MTEITPFAVRETSIPGLLAVDMKQASDERGTIREFYRRSAFVDAGLADLGPWVQVNVTESALGAIRGLHGEQMHKLVAVVSGEAFAAYLDVRTGSPTRGTVETMALAPGTQVLVPPGVCNGFQALTDAMQYLYCFDSEWRPDMPGVAVSPLDPALGIRWPIEIDASDPAIVSAKDRSAPLLADLRAD